SVAVQIQIRRLRILWRPRRIALPRIGSRLERRHLPIRFRALAVQVVAEESSFDILAEFEGRLVTAKWHDADTVTLRRLPLSVKPRAGHHQIGMAGIVLRGMLKDLPR